VTQPRVLLIGGPPGAGKTTLGRSLAAALGWTSLSVDDLMVAAKVVTTPESHPGLHVMKRPNHVEYFTGSSVDQLTADADLQHEAVWPSVERVIRNHATFGSPIVIDGWHLRPDRVTGMDLDSVLSFWLVIDPSVLEERERKNVDFFHESPDPERMLGNFMGRSLWYNDLIRRETTRLGLHVLFQDGSVSVEALCRQVLQVVQE